jgi:hypothetical protein
MVVSFRHPIFSRCVGHVVGLRSNKQMIRPNAERIIAAVTHH